MNIARILYPVEVLGPGKRVGIWMAGCPHHCPGCSNPELWEQRPECELPVDSVIDLLKQSLRDKEIDGFVLTGGDPFYQPEELAALLIRLRAWTNDILVYTGYTYEHLRGMEALCIQTCLQNTGVLIDGPYIEALNNGTRLRGSSNQQILFLEESLKPLYEQYMEAGPNRIQNFMTADGMVSVGIHRPDFKEALSVQAKNKGVMICGE